MTRFVLLAAPRTGSNWLCTLLDSHPEVLCHHELFNPAGVHLALSLRDTGAAWANPRGRDLEPGGWLDRVWADSHGCQAVGFKLNRGQSPEAFGAVLADPTVRKIVLSRANRVRTYVSERLAESTGHWESFLDGVAPSPLPPIEVDAEALARHVETNRRYFDELRAALAGTCQTYCNVIYEELAEPATHRRLLAYLGVDPEQPLAGATRRQTPLDLRRVVSNFPILAEALRGDELGSELSSAALAP